MSKGSYDLFFDRLGLLESGDNYSFVGLGNELGRYQLDEAQLIAADFVFADKSPGVNDYAGGFTGRQGVTSERGFLFDPHAQDVAVRRFMAALWTALGDDTRFEGQVLDGHKITTSGLIAGAFLAGEFGMRTYLESGGDTNPVGAGLFEYLQKLGGFDTPFIVNHDKNEKTSGGSGDDVLRGFGGDDFLEGQAGDDHLRGGDGNDVLDGGLGDDLVDGGTGNDNLDGGDGADRLSGRAGDDVVDGGVGDDVLTGGNGADDMQGGGGDDRLVGGAGFDVLAGASGNDALSGEGGDDQLKGDAGDDDLQGGNGADQISGGTGADTIVGGAGADDLRGGGGADVIHGGLDADTISGGGADDTLLGGGGGDNLDGGGGDDLLNGGVGGDSINGGGDNDTISGGADDDTLTGGQGDDFVLGDGGDDTVDGGDGMDSVQGGDGNDTLTGGLGNDVLVGGGGADVQDGGAGTDYSLGGEGDDILLGGSDDDTLLGDNGDDLLDGGNGRDFMSGGTGDDTFVLSGPRDFVLEIQGNGGGNDTVIVTAAGEYAFNNIEILKINADSAIKVTIASGNIDSLHFDSDDGGTICYQLSAEPEEKIVDVNFGAGKDIFVFDANGFDAATGVFQGTTQVGYFWGFDMQDVEANDRVDLTSLGIDVLVTGTQSSNIDGQFLLAPGARIEIGALFYENATDGWYFVDSTTGLFSPSITGNLTADNFIV